MLRGKPGKAANWLPTQVFYGIDTSDPEPERWQPFGSIYEQQREVEKHAAVKSGVTAASPGAPAKQ